MVTPLNYPKMKGVPWFDRGDGVELHGWEDGDRHFLMNTRSMQIVTGKACLLDALTNLIDEGDHRAVRNVLDLRTAELMTWHMSPNVPLMVSNQPKRLTLNVTHACNLRCRYCFVGNEYDPSTETMTVETAKRAIDQFGPEGITFFGGEPLMAWDLIKEIVPYARKRGCKGFHITTNGTLLTKEHAEYIAKNGITLIVSMDGPPELHDDARPFQSQDGPSSHAATMNALELLKEAGVRSVTLRATFDQTGSHLIERLEYLNDLVDRGYAGHVSVEPSYLSEDCRAGDTRITSDWMNGQAGEYARAFAWCLSRVQGGSKVTWHHMSTHMSRVWHGEHHLSECGAGKGVVTVGPTGDVFACHRESHTKIGDLVNGIDQRKRDAWVDNRRADQGKCSKCPIRFHCGGGCRQNSLNECHDICVPADQECALRWILFRECVNLLAEAECAQDIRVLTGEGQPNEAALRTR